MKKPVLSRAALVLVLLAGVLQASGIAQAPQAPPAPPAGQPVFRSTQRLIVQTISVKDKDGNPVKGLTAADFVVTEDGQPQEIAFVEFQRLAGAPEQAPAAAVATTVTEVLAGWS